MSDAPERIWLGRDERYQGEPWIRLASDFDEEESETQEYIRADLAAPDLAELVGLLQEARTDLQSYVDHDYPPETCAAHPSVARQHFRDMELCRRIDAALAKIKEQTK